MAYGFNDDRSKVEVYTKEEVNALLDEIWAAIRGSSDEQSADQQEGE